MLYALIRFDTFQFICGPGCPSLRNQITNERQRCAQVRAVGGAGGGGREGCLCKPTLSDVGLSRACAADVMESQCGRRVTGRQCLPTPYLCV